MEIRAQRAQYQNRALTGSACLIGKASSEPALCHPPIPPSLDFWKKGRIDTNVLYFL